MRFVILRFILVCVKKKEFRMYLDKNYNFDIQNELACKNY